MKITSESLADRQVQLQIELEEPELEQHKQRAYRKLVQQYNVPGFRKGKAPRHILERYLGADTLVQEDLEALLDKTVMDAVEQENLEPVARPQITEIESLEPISFKATVPLKPEVTLGDYKAIRVPWEEAKATDEEIEEVLENLRKQGTPWEPVDRAAELGDMLTVDIDGYVEEEDAEGGRRDFIEEKSISYLSQESVTYPVPGFAEHLIGMKADETREFTISVPDDFTVRDLNGKDANFTVTLHEVKSQVPPEMDDEWAKSVTLTEDDSFESLADLREKIQTDLQERSEAQAHSEYEEKVLDALNETTSMEYPPVMVDTEIDHLIQDQDQQLRGMGISLASYLASSGQDPDQIRETVRPQAEQRVLRALLISEVSEAEKIEPSDDEVQEEIDRVLEGQPEGDAREQARQLFDNPEARETVERRLVARKTVDLLTNIARTEDASTAVKKPKRASTRRAKAAAEPDADANEEQEKKPVRRSSKRTTAAKDG